MATTIPMRPKRGPRVRESAPGDGDTREAQYDLLTAALIGAAAAVAAVIVSQPLAAKAFASVLGFTLHASAQLVHFIHAGLAVSELFTTVGNAVARAAATREGVMTLIVTATVAGTSLLALQQLLFSEEEVSQWQELS